MKEEEIQKLIEKRTIRKKEMDKERIKSLIKATEDTIKAVKNNIALNEENATIIFKETYDSIRSVADAFWWHKGYEVIREHDISLMILNELNLKNKYKLNFLERFKKIRNDASYRGFKISVEQAKEIIDFWDTCMLEALDTIKAVVE